jgi:DNA topoisomerase III
MSGHKLYLCEKPDQGRIIAKSLGGGQKTTGGITGPDWKVTWAFGHLLTPFMPHDYDEALKRWEWDPLPIVPEKFQFKPKDGMSGKQITAISNLMKGASQVVISTDADREGELIAYEILNRLKWKGDTKRLWLSDLTVPAVQKALGSLKEASETKPLYWAAAGRTYADWLVGMNMSRAATLKLAAPGGKPMSVGRVQTPVLAMIVDLERKIVNFKPEDYFEITAMVAAPSGTIKMRHAPAPEKRIKDRAHAESLLAKVTGASGPLSVKTEAKKQGPPALLDLNAVQQECNSRFGWSADKSLKIAQALYEQHQLLTYPRTDSRALPDEHKVNIPTIAENLSATAELSHLAPHLKSPMTRSSVYNDAKVTAHHAVVPTNKSPGNLQALSPDEKKLYLLVSRWWIAAHMPDMEYLQTTIALDANGVPLKASGRQITNPGWKQAFLTASGQEDAAAAKEEAEDDEDQSNLPPLKDRETGKVEKAQLDAKKTKPPSRFTESTLLKAMKNIAAHVDDAAAKKTLKETSGIGTPATRANVIETLKARDYIKVKKRQLVPTDTAYVLIDAMRATAPSYADPVMTARWEDVLEQIASGPDTGMMKRFVDGIAGSVRKDVARIKDANIERMAGAPRKGGGKTYAKGRIEGDWKVAIAEGTKITVPFDKKEDAKELGARWNADEKCWVIPKGHDTAPFQKAGFL